MNYRNLGTSDLSVSVVGLGTMSWPFCYYGQVTPAEAKLDRASVQEMVGTALDHGINLFDTAEAYGRGLAETLLGESLEKLGRRQDAVIVTKVGPLFAEEPDRQRACNLSAPHILARCEGSLRRLKTDYIDLYLVHWPDSLTPLEETVGAMLQLQREGKIRHFGVSNFNNDLLGQAMNFGKVAANQLPYSLIERNIDWPQRPYCLEKGVGIMAYSPLGKGMLSGKYNAQHLPPQEDDRHQQPQFSRENLQRHFAVAERCREIATHLGILPAQLAMAWCLAQPGITTVLPGAKSPAQVVANAGAGKINLPKLVLDELNRLTMNSPAPGTDRV